MKTMEQFKRFLNKIRKRYSKSARKEIVRKRYFDSQCKIRGWWENSNNNVFFSSLIMNNLQIIMFKIYNNEYNKKGETKCEASVYALSINADILQNFPERSLFLI